MEADANGSASNEAKASSGEAPSSRWTTRAAASLDMAGAEARKDRSALSYVARCASGMKPST
jgi:hypothetical protein